MRRHALTHAVGDVAPEGLEERETDNNLSDEEDDALLEVDSPVNSPNAGRSSPGLDGPVVSEGTNNDEKLNQEDPGDVIVQDDAISGDGNKEIAVTHCHHERDSGSKSPYTMRPMSYDSYIIKHHTSIKYASNEQQITATSSLTSTPQSSPDIFIPTLHVRRDLHQKLQQNSNSSNTTPSASTTRITSTMLEANYINSIPIRKRPIGLDGEPHPIMPRNLISTHLHLNQSLEALRQSKLMEETKDKQEPSTSSSKSSSTNIPNNGCPIPGTSIIPPSGTTKVIQASSGHPPNPPKKTGFSIEDIMRR